jgi:hypothetical protein
MENAISAYAYIENLDSIFMLLIQKALMGGIRGR